MGYCRPFTSIDPKLLGWRSLCARVVGHHPIEPLVLTLSVAPTDSTPTWLPRRTPTSTHRRCCLLHTKFVLTLSVTSVGYQFLPYRVEDPDLGRRPTFSLSDPRLPTNSPTLTRSMGPTLPCWCPDDGYLPTGPPTLPPRLVSPTLLGP